MTICFWLFDNVGTALAVLTYFLKCLQLLFWAICSRHIALYIFWSWKTTNKRPNELQPNLGTQVTVGVQSNHLSSSSNSPHLFASFSLFLSPSMCSPLLRCYLSTLSLSFHIRGVYLLNLWVLVVCGHMHACVFCDCELMGASGPYCILSMCYGPHVVAHKLGRFGLRSCTYISAAFIIKYSELCILRMKCDTLHG